MPMLPSGNHSTTMRIFELDVRINPTNCVRYATPFLNRIEGAFESIRMRVTVEDYSWIRQCSCR
jgi:hypothetical protein